ncbi:hypothetical protein MMC06_001223 [Schaereria dolodes]|nr:hypothetical protein [Schaereria dolodes]
MEDGHDQDDVPQLSGAALSALQDFYRDRDAQEKNFEDLKSAIKESEQNTKLSMETFTEDWNTSQFWYSDETAIILAEQLLSNATKETSIAIVSAPSVFIQIKNLLSSGTYIETPHIALLEFDERFAVLAEFVHYDFHFPLKLPSEMKGKYDRIICDPPFLSTDCQTKGKLWE